jgi:hypothetical protein
MSLFGNNNTNQPNSSFGFGSPLSFGFGNQNGSSQSPTSNTTGFSFANTSNTTENTSTGFSFGNTSSNTNNNSTLGFGNSTSGSQTTGGFSGGGPVFPNTNTGFNFGNSSSGTNSGGFSFGGSNASTGINFSGGATSNSGFNFGNNPGGTFNWGTGFNFGNALPNNGFGFGNNNGFGGGGWTFGFGTHNTVKLLQESLENMYKAKIHTDVTFVFPEDRKIVAHKCILAARSEIFRAMFESKFEESKGVINVKEYTEDAFSNFIHYMYTASFSSINFDNYSELLDLSKYYMVDSMKDDVESFVLNNSSGRNLDIVTLQHLLDLCEKFELKRLKRTCFLCLKQNYSLIAREIFDNRDKKFVMEFLDYMHNNFNNNAR